MTQYLIALDLDGTLLTNDHKISTRAQKVLRQLKKQGHIVVIVTGRPFHSSYSYYKQLQLTTPLINHNGAFMHTPNKANEEVIHEPLNYEMAKKIIHEVEQKFDLVALSAERYNNVYLQKSSSIFDQLYRFGTPHIIHGQIIQQLKEAPTSIILHTKDDQTDAINDYLEENYGKWIEHRCWGMPTTIVELTKKGINKATTLAKVAHKFGITREHIIAFGDQDNDLEMLDYAGIGVAMENAHPTVKAVANHITASNEEDGVARFLEEIFSPIMQ